MTVQRSPPLSYTLISSESHPRSCLHFTSAGPRMLWSLILKIGGVYGISHSKFLSPYETVSYHIGLSIGHTLLPLGCIKWDPPMSSDCWHCSHTLGDFIHVFWSCPVIKVYWTQILSVINDLLGISVAPSPHICLLGLVEELVPRVVERTLIGLLLFYARKMITLCWKKQAPPSLSLWKTHVNIILPLYKDTYYHRGCS